MSWDFDNDRPIYQQIVRHLERAVVGGEYPPGGKLPTVRELAADAGVNPNTMQRALSELENEGLVSTKRTSGRFVTEDLDLIKDMRKRIAVDHTDIYLNAMHELGYEEQAIIHLIGTRQKKIGGLTAR